MTLYVVCYIGMGYTIVRDRVFANEAEAQTYIHQNRGTHKEWILLIGTAVRT